MSLWRDRCRDCPAPTMYTCMRLIAYNSLAVWALADNSFVGTTILTRKSWTNKQKSPKKYKNPVSPPPPHTCSHTLWRREEKIVPWLYCIHTPEILIPDTVFNLYFGPLFNIYIMYIVYCVIRDRCVLFSLSPSSPSFLTDWPHC